MIEFQDVRRLLQESSMKGRAIQELRIMFRLDEPVQELSRGVHAARDARATYLVRRGTAARAGADVWGMDELLETLEGLPTSCPLHVFHYGTSTKVFSVFVQENDGSLVACVGAPRRVPEEEVMTC